MLPIPLQGNVSGDGQPPSIPVYNASVAKKGINLSERVGNMIDCAADSITGSNFNLLKGDLTIGKHVRYGFNCMRAFPLIQVENRHSGYTML